MTTVIKLTVIKEAIHWKVIMLQKPAPYSLEIALSAGMGGARRSLSGFNFRYHLVCGVADPAL